MAENGLPPLPRRNAQGNYPAVAYARAVTARDVIVARRRLGLSQAELARRAGVSVETLNRIERVKPSGTPSPVASASVAPSFRVELAQQLH